MDRCDKTLTLSCNFLFKFSSLLSQACEFLILQDHEVVYFQKYVDGVDFVFIDNSIFYHREQNIYGGDRLVR